MFMWKGFHVIQALGHWLYSFILSDVSCSRELPTGEVAMQEEPSTFSYHYILSLSVLDLPHLLFFFFPTTVCTILLSTPEDMGGLPLSGKTTALLWRSVFANLSFDVLLHVQTISIYFSSPTPSLQFHPTGSSAIQNLSCTSSCLISSITCITILAQIAHLRCSHLWLQSFIPFPHLSTLWHWQCRQNYSFYQVLFLFYLYTHQNTPQQFICSSLLHRCLKFHYP